MNNHDELQDSADKASELLEQKSPHQLAVELASLQRKHGIAVSALNNIGAQRDQLAAQLKDATAQCGAIGELVNRMVIMMGMAGDEAESGSLNPLKAWMFEAQEALSGKLPDVKLSTSTNWPDKCPITRRAFFMEIDGVPTYGGPYDSYTIPEMLGTPDQPWHDRELFVRRFDHDRGHWVDDEVIDLRVIHDGVLDDLLGDQVPEGWQLVPVEPTESMIGHGCGASVMVVSEVVTAWGAMLAAAPKP